MAVPARGLRDFCAFVDTKQLVNQGDQDVVRFAISGLWLANGPRRIWGSSPCCAWEVGELDPPPPLTPHRGHR